ncbi:MAG TPA: site-specific DNA-methyltransferase, partial [Candidatus Nitrosopolaris rasttigaisensis]|nr:site-specific DNA-methyltransferase [Candidatus Nitrosopolaris rasttigaisensis]
DTSMFNGDKPEAPSNYNDTGSASRFFYSSKASAKDRIYTCTICNCSIFKTKWSFHQHDKWKEDGDPDFNHITSHPTCKPISLMRYLVRLVTPPNGTVLDPFCGSGTTLQAANEEGFSSIGIEQKAEYADNIRYRMKNLQPPKNTLF